TVDYVAGSLRSSGSPRRAHRQNPDTGPGRERPRPAIRALLGQTSAAPAAPRTSPAAGPATAAPARPAARSALGLWPRLVDHQVPISEEAAVQHFHSPGCLLFGGHLDEAEPARASSELICDDAYGFDSAGLLEQLSKVFLRGLEGEVADEQ